MGLACRLLAVAFAGVVLTWGQAIEFESGGLRYQTLTRNGLTVMLSVLPTQVRDYAIVQVAVQNGSDRPFVVRPDDFRFVPESGPPLTASAPRAVVDEFLERAGRNDVIKMVSTYELGLYGLSRFKSTNGYEERRRNAQAELGSPRLRAAAAASAVVFVQTRLSPGESTDGALFYPANGRPLGNGRFVATIAGQIYEFSAEPGGLPFKTRNGNQ